MLKLSEDLKKFFSGLRLVYFGTGEFAVHPLNSLVAVGVKPLAVVTSPDTKTGREQIPTPSPVKTAVLSLPSKGFIESPPSLLQPEKLDAALLQEIKKLKPNICILADYGKILPPALLAIPPHAFLNIHPSLLPKYRGASPIETAMINGETETGVTIMLMDDQLDHGPLVARQKTKIRDRETAPHLQKRLAHISARLLLRTLPRYMTGMLKPKEQDHTQATFTRILSREDGKISFAEDAEILDRKVRTLTPWPGTYAIWKNTDGEKRLKILEAMADTADASRTTEADTQPAYGTVIAQEDGLGVITSNGILKIHKLQLEGKKPMTAREFFNGYPTIVGTILL